MFSHLEDRESYCVFEMSNYCRREEVSLLRITQLVSEIAGLPSKSVCPSAPAELQLF